MGLDPGSASADTTGLEGIAQMAKPIFDTSHQIRCVQRWQAGERAAADELLRTIGDRLEKLTRKMLRTFPNIRAWAETADVFQEASCLALRRQIGDDLPLA